MYMHSFSSFQATTNEIETTAIDIETTLNDIQTTINAIETTLNDIETTTVSNDVSTESTNNSIQSNTTDALRNILNLELSTRVPRNQESKDTETAKTVAVVGAAAGGSALVASIIGLLTKFKIMACIKKLRKMNESKDKLKKKYSQKKNKKEQEDGDEDEEKKQTNKRKQMPLGSKNPATLKNDNETSNYKMKYSDFKSGNDNSMSTARDDSGYASGNGSNGGQAGSTVPRSIATFHDFQRPAYSTVISPVVSIFKLFF